MVGAAVAASGAPGAAWLSTWTIYSGAAQLITLDALANGSGWVAAATAGLVVQLRLPAYSTAMVADWRDAPLALRLLAGVLLSDAPWALAQGRDADRRGFYLGAGLTLFVAWPAMVTVGMVAGGIVGDTAAAALVPALVLGCTVARHLSARPVLAAAGAAGLSALVTMPVSAGAAFVSAAVVGVIAGAAAEHAGARSTAGGPRS
jgi:predicted branched-subunit amino acid permease